MTDAHCHLPLGGFRHFVAEPCAADAVRPGDVAFLGVHPWEANALENWPAALARLGQRLSAEPAFGVGEIGLDRLRDRTVSERMRRVFEDQLRLAADLRRPVILHGAKCWGQVVDTIRRLGVTPAIPSFVFHGFSRSDGLLPAIARLHGFVSVGPAVLNDHAINYRQMVRNLPEDLLLVETDRTAETSATCPPLADIVAEVAELRGTSSAEIEAVTDFNARACVAPLS